MVTALPLLQRSNSVVILAFVIFNVFSFATLLIEVPLVRLFEQSICNRYYRGHGPPSGAITREPDEAYCKISPIQDVLSTLIGWKMAFDALPGF